MYINDELSRQNPWWLNSKISAEDPTKPQRDILPVLRQRVLQRDLITAVVGLRRVGKTTAIRQIIDQLLQKGYPRPKLVYYSFEEGAASREILEAIIEYCLKMGGKDKIYLFLDEIQYVDGWNSVLKKYFDLSPNLKFTVTGSSSLFIATKARESLAGRIQEIIMYPLGYGEYLRIHKGLDLPAAKILSEEGLVPHTDELRKNFSAYLAGGEFPYLPLLTNWSEKREYVLNFVIGKVVENDLPRLKKIYKTTELTALSEALISDSGQLVEMQNLGTDLGISRQSLRDYTALLEKTNLISAVFNRGTGFRTRSRLRKIYSASTNALVLKTSLGEQSESFSFKIGQYLETFVFNYLVRQQAGEIYFWRQRQKEVDFILVTPESVLPIEVKYQNRIRPSDIENLLYFCRKERLNQGIIVTRDKSGRETIKGVAIRFLPAHFLI